MVVLAARPFSEFKDHNVFVCVACGLTPEFDRPVEGTEIVGRAWNLPPTFCRSAFHNHDALAAANNLHGDLVGINSQLLIPFVRQINKGPFFDLQRRVVRGRCPRPPYDF